MEKYTFYEKEDVRKEAKKIYSRLKDITNYLTSEHHEKEVVEEINNIVGILNEFEVNSEKFPSFNLDEKGKSLDRRLRKWFRNLKDKFSI